MIFSQLLIVALVGWSATEWFRTGGRYRPSQGGSLSTYRADSPFLFWLIGGGQAFGLLAFAYFALASLHIVPDLGLQSGPSGEQTGYMIARGMQSLSYTSGGQRHRCADLFTYRRSEGAGDMGGSHSTESQAEIWHPVDNRPRVANIPPQALQPCLLPAGQTSADRVMLHFNFTHSQATGWQPEAPQLKTLSTPTPSLRPSALSRERLAREQVR